MEKKFKLIISPERCDAEALAHFIAELERLKLGVLTNGEIVYDDKNEKEVFNLMEYLQLIIPQYFISNKSGIWSLSLIVHSKG